MQAQTSIPVLPSVYVRDSTTSASTSDPDIFGSQMLNLTCPAKPTGILSSNSGADGNILVDNSLFLTSVQGTSNPIGPVDLCVGGSSSGSCFNTNYENNYSSYLGVDPDTFAASGGLPPIDIGSYLAAGPNQLTIQTIDYGVVLTATTINLYTNCSSTGASTGGTISGNPIPSSNPPADVLTQTFSFSNTTNKIVQGVLDLSAANTAGTLTIQNNTIPIFSDIAFDATKWPSYVAGTSLATSACLVHFGEVLPNGDAACKLYTIVCQVGTDPTLSGLNCPTSTDRNIAIEDIFDGPDFSLPNIYADGSTFHTGFGFLETSDDWAGGPCTFEPGSDQIFSCPENLLTLFTGPGTTKGTGTPNGHLNSSFISVGGVPEYLTSVSFNYYCSHQKWVNHHNVQATFKTIPPVVPKPNNNFVASPVYSITYGVSAQDALPSPEFPVPGDISLYAPAGCTTPAPAKPFQPAPVAIDLPDGKYFVHYFATDCAGTEELKFYQDASHSWNTTFYTQELDIDTVKPVLVSGPTLSPAPTPVGGALAYHKGTPVVVQYECADSLSGIDKCGYITYSSPVADTGPLTMPVNTTKVGTFTVGVYVRDAAQNVGTEGYVTYTVVP
jgi:hypothetical protein